MQLGPDPLEEPGSNDIGCARGKCLAAFALRVRVGGLRPAAEPKRFLKQARPRPSHLFFKDCARSSLPQYLHASFSALAAARSGRRAAFLGFE
jgi:hypothetical protein